MVSLLFSVWCFFFLSSDHQHPELTPQSGQLWFVFNRSLFSLIWPYIALLRLDFLQHESQPGHIILRLCAPLFFVLLIYSCLVYLNSSLRTIFVAFFSWATFCCFVIMQHALDKYLPQKPLLTQGNELPNPMQLTEDAPSGQHSAFVKCVESFSIYTVISSRQNQLSYTRGSVLMLAHLLYCL